MEIIWKIAPISEILATFRYHLWLFRSHITAFVVFCMGTLGAAPCRRTWNKNVRGILIMTIIISKHVQILYFEMRCAFISSLMFPYGNIGHSLGIPKREVRTYKKYEYNFLLKCPSIIIIKCFFVIIYLKCFHMGASGTPTRHSVKFLSVRLIYFDSLLHNSMSNRTGVNVRFFIALKIISQISVWFSVRIKRKRFVFNHMGLFYFKKKPATPLRYGSRNMKKLICKEIFA